jgi:D-amino-acid dehydrogenase
MRIMVLGAGVIGLTSAYFLQRAGHDVVVVDRRPGVASETSFGNGGQLSYSYVAPLAGPGVLSKLPVWLTRADSPVRLRPSIDPAQWSWCLQFALACTRERSELTTRALLSLSFLSRSLMHDLIRDEASLDFDFRRSGKLVLHRDAHAMHSAAGQLDFQRALGCEQEALDADACIALEPALAGLRGPLAGGIYTPSEDSGDCYRFCTGLEAILRTRGVAFMLDTSIDRLSLARDGRVVAHHGATTIDAEQIVVATGAAARQLLKPLGIRVPLYPLKGYSVTYPLRPDAVAPTLSVTDFARKVVYARLGDRLRVAGMADIEGYSAEIDGTRIAALHRETAALFPDAAASAKEAREWAGLRPATPRGTPVVGPTRYKNVWLNIGHGALGFTLATGSAALLTDWLASRQDPSMADLFAIQ